MPNILEGHSGGKVNRVNGWEGEENTTGGAAAEGDVCWSPRQHSYHPKHRCSLLVILSVHKDGRG